MTIMSGAQRITDAPERQNQAQCTNSLLTLNVVRQRTGLSRTTIWRWEKLKKFPQRVYVGARSPRWVESEVDEWIETLKADREGRREQ